EGRALLQPQGHGRAMDKRGEECAAVDEAVVPALPGQYRSVAAVRLGVPPGQLPWATGAAPADPGLDADDAAGAADQARGQGGEALAVPPRSAGGSRRRATVVCPDPGAKRPLVCDLCLGLRLGCCYATESESRRRAFAVPPVGG